MNRNPDRKKKGAELAGIFSGITGYGLVIAGLALAFFVCAMLLNIYHHPEKTADFLKTTASILMENRLFTPADFARGGLLAPPLLFIILFLILIFAGKVSLFMMQSGRSLLFGVLPKNMSRLIDNVRSQLNHKTGYLYRRLHILERRVEKPDKPG